MCCPFDSYIFVSLFEIRKAFIFIWISTKCYSQKSSVFHWKWWKYNILLLNQPFIRNNLQGANRTSTSNMKRVHFIKGFSFFFLSPAQLLDRAGQFPLGERRAQQSSSRPNETIIFWREKRSFSIFLVSSIEIRDELSFCQLEQFFRDINCPTHKKNSQCFVLYTINFAAMN